MAQDFQNEVIRTVMTSVAKYGFAIAGGRAAVFHEIVDRPTEDLDAFSNRFEDDVLPAARRPGVNFAPFTPNVHSGSPGSRNKIEAIMSTLSTTETEDIRVSDSPTEDEHPGWMKRLGKRVYIFLRLFRQAVDRKPWLALAYKITISVIGGVVILAGLAMLVLPGPGWLTIFLGLAILGSEFSWARRILTSLRRKVHEYADRYRRWRAARRAAKRETPHER